MHSPGFFKIRTSLPPLYWARVCSYYLNNYFSNVKTAFEPWSKRFCESLNLADLGPQTPIFSSVTQINILQKQLCDLLFLLLYYFGKLVLNWLSDLHTESLTQTILLGQNPPTELVRSKMTSTVRVCSLCVQTRPESSWQTQSISLSSVTSCAWRRTSASVDTSNTWTKLLWQRKI